MPHNRERFFATTHWADRLTGQQILEAGCGAGRFSSVALSTGAEVFSFDLSVAVEACLENIPSTQKPRHHLFQASIYEIPLAHEMFDKIFCLGVLQHCPDVKRAFLSLIPHLKPGGELAVDCYWRQPLRDAFNPKYLLRPFFKWWEPALLFKFWTAVISATYDLKALLNRIPVAGPPLARMIPIGRLNFEPDLKLSVPEIKEIKTLSVFDMLSPKYDQPQTLETFEAWIHEAGLETVKLTLGHNGINAVVRKATRDPRPETRDKRQETRDP
jgi:SAM-dependent methyltransferase